MRRITSLVDLLLEEREEMRKYYEGAFQYLRRIKEAVRRFDREARVLLFGSFAKGTYRPDSDIDVLVVTKLADKLERRLEIRVRIAEDIGRCTPFEIHIVTPREYEEWYTKFIDRYVEI